MLSKPCNNIDFSDIFIYFPGTRRISRFSAINRARETCKKSSFSRFHGCVNALGAGRTLSSALTGRSKNSLKNTQIFASSQSCETFFCARAAADVYTTGAVALSQPLGELRRLPLRWLWCNKSVRCELSRLV